MSTQSCPALLWPVNTEEATPVDADPEFHSWRSSELSRLDGPGLVLDCILHLLLLRHIAKMVMASQEPTHPGVWAYCVLSFLYGAAQGVWLLARRELYMKHRLTIIVVRRLSVVAMFCKVLPILLASWQPTTGRPDKSGSSSPLWAVARLLLTSSAAVVNVTYVLWFRTRFAHCFLLNLASMCIVLSIAPSACQSTLRTDGVCVRDWLLFFVRSIECSIAVSMVIHPFMVPETTIAAVRQRCMTSWQMPSPELLNHNTVAAAAATHVASELVHSSSVLSGSSGAGGSVGTLGSLAEAERLQHMCTALVSTTQLMLGLFVPAFILYFREQCRHMHFVTQVLPGRAQDSQQRRRPVQLPRFSVPLWALPPWQLVMLGVLWLSATTQLSWYAFQGYWAHTQ